MRRIFAMLLCILLLCCFGCKREEFVTGEYYMSDGFLQNTEVNLIITSEDLTEPVTSLTYEIHNDTDYETMRFAPNYRLEIYRDGTWQAAPEAEHDLIGEVAMLYSSTENPVSKESLRIEDFQSVIRPGSVYAPLTAGFYRFCVWFDFPDDDRKEKAYMITYFQVREAAE